MPPANMPEELVDEAYRAWNADGPHAFGDFTTDNVELHDAPDLPDAQKWVGRDAVVARLEDVVATTGGTWADIDDIRSLGDEVLVSLTWRLDRESATTLAAVYHLVRVEGDRIARSACSSMRKRPSERASLRTLRPPAGVARVDPLAMCVHGPVGRGGGPSVVHHWLGNEREKL